MKLLIFPFLIFIAFAWSMGYYAHRTCFAHTPTAYIVDGKVEMMSFPSRDVEYPHLYLRRVWHLNQQPIGAWIELRGHDELSFFVNGHRVQGRTRNGTRRVTSVLADITPFLQVGKNAIAIYAKQMTIGRPPQVAVLGEYTTPDGKRHVLNKTDGWRVSNLYDRRGYFWYQTKFNDDHWAAPQVDPPRVVTSSVDVPPLAIRQLFDAPWVVPDSSSGTASVARKFEIPDSPKNGWLRIVTTSPCRIAVNGIVVGDDSEDLAQPPPFRSQQLTFDISALLLRGTNVVSMLMTEPGETPRLRADLGFETQAGESAHIVSNERWKTNSRSDVNWLSKEINESQGWTPCLTDRSYARLPPWLPRREVRPIQENGPLQWLRTKRLAICVLAASVVAWLGCLLTGRIVCYLDEGMESCVRNGFVWLTLVPSTLLASLAFWIERDANYAQWNVFAPNLFLLLLIAVAIQWFLILFLSAATGPRQVTLNKRHGGFTVFLLLTCIFAAGLGLRLRHLVSEPIHHDEVGAYAFTMGVVNNGIPSGQVHEDLRYGIAATSELVYYPMALAAMIFEDPLEVIRVPAVVFSMLTVLLGYHVGTQFFNRTAGIVAASIVAFAPYEIGMATFGRYFSQLQLMTLLTVYLTFQAVHTVKGVRIAYLWAATASFIGMYFSWEGSGMIGPPLAIAVLWHRRRHLKSLLCSPHLYAGSFLVLSAFFYQNGHRTLQQTQRMWYGTGISALQIKPMWRYPLFDLEYYLIEASWLRVAIVPALLLLTACGLSVRHRFRRKLHFLLIVLVGTALIMGAILPLRSGRYSYHLVGLMILVCAAAAGAGSEWAIRAGQGIRVPKWCLLYATSIAVLFVGVTGVMGSGQLIRPSSDNPMLNTLAFDIDQLRYPNWERPMRYLRDELQDGDIVISHMPHVVEFSMQRILDPRDQFNVEDRWRVDYWLQSSLILQSSLGDDVVAPRDRRSGAKMIANINQLKRIFAENERVWYLTSRYGQGRINDADVSKYIRNNMDVTYEDFITTVMLRDANHRPADVQVRDDELGEQAREFYLK